MTGDVAEQQPHHAGKAAEDAYAKAHIAELYVGGLLYLSFG